MSVINEDFMLTNAVAKRLYNEYAKDMPIIDYHCHLQPEMIANDHKFKNAFELFLGGDHYKWRQMRTAGIDEEYITGGADDCEKFCRFAKILPMLIGNPLYHWTHLELKRYFGIDEALDGESCAEIWKACNARLAKDEFSAKNLIRRSNVEVVCTTDDPSDNLQWHFAIRDSEFETQVLPTFRPDKCVNIDKDGFCEYIESIGVHSYGGLLKWLTDRVEYFDNAGCRAADHAVESVPYAEGNAKCVFEAKMNGGEVTKYDAEVYKTAILKHLAGEYSRRNWAMQLHIGALRNTNSKMFARLGADTGFDSVNDLNIAEKLAKFLNLLESGNILPKTVLYNLNPKDNYVIGTMLGNFQRAPYVSKLQFGSGWWFNDNRDGMESQIKALANLGMLGGFIGMLTDSRSFVSYPRHEYFRRILCNLVGKWVEDGEYPDHSFYLEKIIRRICCTNAREYFEF